MSSFIGMTTAEILAVFAEEVSTHQGIVNDTLDDGQRLFARSILPRVESLRPGDPFQGGVALRATEQHVWLHPFLFRLVCKNGAIMSQTLATRHLDNLHLCPTDEAEQFLRAAVASCCTDDVFTETVHQVRGTWELQTDMALNLMPLLSRFPVQEGLRILSEIANRFYRAGDRSRYGLFNAVTAVARDTRDPELRWNLEEFGGGIAIGKTPGPRDPSTLAATQRRNAIPSDLAEQHCEFAERM